MDYRHYGRSTYKPTSRDNQEDASSELPVEGQALPPTPPSRLGSRDPFNQAHSSKTAPKLTFQAIQSHSARLVTRLWTWVKTHRSPKVLLALLGLFFFGIWFFLGEFRFMFWRAPSFTGFPFSSRNYLILFQNNYELRPTGGFISTYGELTFAHGFYTGLTLHDVYGEIDDHAREAAPLVVSTLLEDPNYQGHSFRDANFDPDFRITKDELIRFYTLTHPEAEVDGILAVDFHFLEQWLKAYEPLVLEQYESKPLTSDNLFEVLSAQVSDVDRHSLEVLSQRKDIQKPLVTTLIKKTLIFPWRITAFLDLMAQNFREKHLLATFNLKGLQNSFHYRAWDGALPQSDAGDFLAINLANYGGMKGDRYLKKDVQLELEASSERDILSNPIVKAKVTVTLSHEGFYDAPFSGDYAGYLRVMIPRGSKILKGGSVSENRSDSEVLGEIVRLKPGETMQLTYEYELPEYVWQNGVYTLHLHKQPGTEADQVRVVLHAPVGMSWIAPEFDVRESTAFYDVDLATDVNLSFELKSDTAAPRLLSNELTALNEITVEFNEPLQSQGAALVSNYQVIDLNQGNPNVTDSVTVIGARAEGRFLIITTEGMTAQPEEFYEVVLVNIADRQGNVQSPEARTVTVVQRGLPEVETNSDINSNPEILPNSEALPEEELL